MEGWQLTNKVPKTLASKKRIFVFSPIERPGTVSVLTIRLELLRERMEGDFAVELSLLLDVLEVRFAVP
jgi:hypothetical protein